MRCLECDLGAIGLLGQVRKHQSVQRIRGKALEHCGSLFVREMPTVTSDATSQGGGIGALVHQLGIPVELQHQDMRTLEFARHGLVWFAHVGQHDRDASLVFEAKGHRGVAIMRQQHGFDA